MPTTKPAANTNTLFGHPLELEASVWEDRSTYAYALRAKPARADGFRPTIVAVREPQRKRGLAAYVAESKKLLSEGVPGALLVRDGKIKAAGLTAWEEEYRLPLRAPLPALRQWHVSLARDGYFYRFCCTGSETGFAQQKAAFQAFLDCWR